MKDKRQAKIEKHFFIFFNGRRVMPTSLRLKAIRKDNVL